MDAMVMRFEADRRARLADLQKGDRVRFRITVRGDRTTIDRLVLLSAARRDVGLLESPAAPLLTPIGGRVPPVALTDHHGRTVTFDALRGRVVAVNFIYTRCPLPDYCPRMLATFRAVRERFAARLDRDLALVTMTFDPLYDTPERLLEYARRHGADVPGWYFLTGPTGNVARIAAAFGIEYWAEEGLLTHTLQTAVLDRDGVLVATIEGKDFTARQAGDLVDAALAAGR
jgi:protein SCO1/2